MKTILSCSNLVLALARFVECSAVETLRKGETMKVNLLISVLCLMSVATLATKDNLGCIKILAAIQLALF